MGRSVGAILAVSMVLGLLPGGQARVYAVTRDQQDIVDRADYLYDQVWVARETVEGWRGARIFEEGGTYHMPYAQPVEEGRYIGFGVSVEDFLRSAAEAGSVFYGERSCYGDGDSTYYGTDCSAFVSWCWGIDRHTTWSIPIVTTVLGMATEENVRGKLRLGDALNSRAAGHVVLVTGIAYDGEGIMESVEITEQTPPQLTRSRYTPKELAEKYEGRYQICRYEGDVPSVPEGRMLSRCTVSPAHGVVETVRDTQILSQPKAGVEAVISVVAGTRITVTGLYEDPGGRSWYRTGDGYLPAEDTV